MLGARLRAAELDVHTKGRPGDKSASGSTMAGFNFLGYSFNPEGVGVGEAGITKLESTLASQFSTLRRESQSWTGEKPLSLARTHWSVNLRITGCIYKNGHRGWLQYYRQITRLEVLKHLDITVRQLSVRSGVADELKFKKFMTGYWRLRHRPSSAISYIPNFDEYGDADMRHVLTEIVGTSDVDRMEIHTVKRLFFQFLDKEVSQLDRDIGAIS